MPKSTGILMIHGTFGSPHEYRELETHLRQDGFQTRAVSLPGHGDRPRLSLDKVSARLIIEHCEAEYMALANRCERVIVVGHSLGGICTLILGGKCPPKLAGLATLAAPYERAHFVNYPQGLIQLPVSHLVPGIRYAPQGYTGLDHPLFMPWWFPRLYKESRLLMAELDQALPQIIVPVHLFHSPYDVIVPYGEMERLAARINQPNLVRMQTLEQCGHQIFPRSDEKERVTRHLFAFFHETITNWTVKVSL